MTQRLARMLDRLTADEQAEVESFVAYLLVRDQLAQNVSSDEIATPELLKLVADSGAFDWLAEESEDVYSIDDGEPVRWPASS